jgi:hypothetical protein
LSLPRSKVDDTPEGATYIAGDVSSNEGVEAIARDALI